MMAEEEIPDPLKPTEILTLTQGEPGTYTESF